MRVKANVSLDLVVDNSHCACCKKELAPNQGVLFFADRDNNISDNEFDLRDPVEICLDADCAESFGLIEARK